MNRHTLVAAGLTALILSACSNDGDDGPLATNPGSNPDGNPGGTLADSRRLRVLDDSEAFYDELRGALIAQRTENRYYLEGDVDFAESDDAAVPESAPVAAPADSADSSGASAGDQAVSGGDNPPDVTGTNVQEVGVDEQDRVKTSSDGQHLYVLQSGYNGFGGPVDTGVGAPEVDPVFPGEDDVISEPADTSFPAPASNGTRLRILELDIETPQANPVRDIDIDLGGRQADGMYLYETDNEQSLLLSSTGYGYWQNWSEPQAFSGADAILTRIDVTDANTASITGNFRIDGQIVSSRRIGKHLFFASRYYPTIPGVDPWSMTLEEWEDTVNRADLSTVLPQYTNNGSQTVTALVDPSECFVARKPENTTWYTPDIITLGVIDLDSMALTDSECYLGATETLYASPDAVYLATTQWDYSNVPAEGPAPEPTIIDGGFQDPRVDTDIHQFDIESGQLSYRGSGLVRGHLGWNELRKPFRMSAKDGNLRVATFSATQREDVSPILVSVLQPGANGTLTRIAELPNEARPAHIGKPGEQLYASRFLGDRAYLVTFRQTDPLYVIDLSNPADPVLAGELEIAGYSDYLQPIGETHLLGIGKDAVPASNGRGDGRGALAQGVKLSLFDVSDPTTPFEVQSVLVGQRGTEATALYNHRAITVQRATDEHPTRVAFGIDVAGNPAPGASPTGEAAFEYYPWSYTGLHGFDVRGGDDAGITRAGVIRVEESNGGYYGPYDRDDRSVLVNDSLFYIHGDRVWSSLWTDMANPVGPR